MKKAQVWVETVIYTLIGLGLIALVLGLLTPRINEYKDRAVIEQTISSMNLLDTKLTEVMQAPGNVRVVEFSIKRGALYIDEENDMIYFEIDDSRVVYSEPGQEANIGKIRVLTTENGNRNIVTLTLDYQANFTEPDETEKTVKLSAASVPYVLSFENNRLDANGDAIIYFREVSEG